MLDRGDKNFGIIALRKSLFPGVKNLTAFQG
jgi:hypothetical protein